MDKKICAYCKINQSEKYSINVSFDEVYNFEICSDCLKNNVKLIMENKNYSNIESRLCDIQFSLDNDLYIAQQLYDILRLLKAK